MFTNFFLELRQAKVPVSIKEYLALMEGMEKNVADYKKLAAQDRETLLSLAARQ